MKKVAFHNLGCKVNSYELDGISQMFQKCGYEIVNFAQKSDIYIINTCTVTNIADRKSRQMIHKAKARNPDAVVVAVGCYVQTDLEGAIRDEAVDVAVGNNHKAELVSIVEEYLSRKEAGTLGLAANAGNVDVAECKTCGGTTVSDLTKPVPYENMSITSAGEHTRAFIKIQDGCNQFCSYCAIPLARGRVRSRSLQDILDEVRTLSENGYKEVVLTGIHLSSYGLTENYNSFAAKSQTNEDLLKVIEEVARIDKITRIRLGSLEPRLLTEEFVERLSKIDKLCPHFHLSLQSGCDEVLKRMNRHYSTKEFKEKVMLLRKYFTHPAITTDVIAGFPGETDEEAGQTSEYLEDINLYECHIFKYSRRTGTVADKLPGQLTDKIKQERSKALIEASDKRKQAFMEYYVGKEVTILVEDEEFINGKKYYTGLTPEYVKCVILQDATAPLISGSEIRCIITKVGKDVAYAMP